MGYITSLTSVYTCYHLSSIMLMYNAHSCLLAVIVVFVRLFDCIAVRYISCNYATSRKNALTIDWL